jgi:exodeoxyribonuclease VII small subunit
VTPAQRTAGDAAEPGDSGAATTSEPPNGDVATMSYEEARDELVDIVARLESEQVDLEESMGLWERGEALASHCSTWLEQAEARIAATEP